MVDRCTITRLTPGEMDPDTGVHAPPGVTQIYSGPCRLQFTGLYPSQVTVAGNVGVTHTRQVHVPVAVVGVRDGDVVTVTASMDPDAVGMTAAVRVLPAKTLATARRLVVQDSGVSA